MTRTAQRQIANWAGIPLKYYDRMGEIESLRAYNLQKWLDQSDAVHLIRTLDGDNRAFLSNSFKPMDNLQVMDAAAPAFAQVPDLQVKALNLTDDRMYVQFILPSLQAEIAVGDPVQAGVCFTNSETGRGAVDIQLMMWRLVCSNGMIAGSVLRRHHLGRRVGGDIEDYEIFKQDTIEAELQSYKLRIRDVLMSYLTDAHWENMVKAVREKAEMPVPAPIRAVENVTKRYGLTDREQESVMSAFIGGTTSNRWNLTNAMTVTARDAENPDRQHELETAGWNLATMPLSEWRRVATDAEGELVG